MQLAAAWPTPAFTILSRFGSLNVTNGSRVPGGQRQATCRRYQRNRETRNPYGMRRMTAEMSSFLSFLEHVTKRRPTRNGSTKITNSVIAKSIGRSTVPLHQKKKPGQSLSGKRKSTIEKGPSILTLGHDYRGRQIRLTYDAGYGLLSQGHVQTMM